MRYHRYPDLPPDPTPTGPVPPANPNPPTPGGNIGRTLAIAVLVAAVLSFFSITVAVVLFVILALVLSVGGGLIGLVTGSKKDGDDKGKEPKASFPTDIITSIPSGSVPGFIRKTPGTVLLFRDMFAERYYRDGEDMPGSRHEGDLIIYNPVLQKSVMACNHTRRETWSFDPGQKLHPGSEGVSGTLEVKELRCLLGGDGKPSLDTLVRLFTERGADTSWKVEAQSLAFSAVQQALTSFTSSEALLSGLAVFNTAATARFIAALADLGLTATAVELKGVKDSAAEKAAERKKEQSAREDQEDRASKRRVEEEAARAKAWAQGGPALIGNAVLGWLNRQSDAGNHSPPSPKNPNRGRQDDDRDRDGDDDTTSDDGNPRRGASEDRGPNDDRRQGRPGGKQRRDRRS